MGLERCVQGFDEAENLVGSKRLCLKVNFSVLI
jgi:hypothetical protein